MAITAKKIVASTVLTIFFGALGSGLWELALQPVLSMLTNNFIALLSTASNTYTNSLYERAGYDPDMLAGIATFQGVLWLIASVYTIICYLLISLRINPNGEARRATHRESSTRVRSALTISAYPMAIASGAIALVVLVSASSTVYAMKASHFVSNSLDRLAPHLTNEELLQLRAQYRQIQDQTSFDLVFERISDAGHE